MTIVAFLAKDDRQPQIPQRISSDFWDPSSLGPGKMAGWGGYDRGYGGHGGGDRRGGGRFPRANAAHDPYEVRLPNYLASVAVCDDDATRSSVIMADDRDSRMVSPFQAWLVKEIMTNSASSINVLTERDQVMPPNTGFHMSLFANYTLDGIKVTLAIAIDSVTGAPCAGWDAPTARALDHPAFHPFTWPVLRDSSPSYTDVKVFNGNELLFHWIFRGFRADTDLSVQQQFCDEFLIRSCNAGRARLSVVVAAFLGWRVSVFSFECGGRTYSVGPEGTVVAGDSARSRWELRVCDRASQDAYGNDADRVEFRFRDANNRIDLKCARTSVPGTWLTVSHISGPTLINTIQEVRRQRARVEGPEQTEQFAQLAAVHTAWFNAAFTTDPTRVGALITFVGGLDAGNFHLQCTSKLFVRSAVVVPIQALANMSHDQAQERPAPSGPLAVTSGSWQEAASASQDVASIADTRSEEHGSARTQYELQVRSFGAAPQFRHEQETTRGHREDRGRDAARADRSFARSTAQLTPGMFAQYMEGSANQGPAPVPGAAQQPVIEEVIETETTAAPSTPPAPSPARPTSSSQAPAQPVNQPASLGPTPPPLIDEEVDTETEVDDAMPAPAGPPQMLRPHRTP